MPSTLPDALIVLDIGKTNVKLTLIDAAGRVLDERRKANTVLTDGLYPHHDTESIWDWMLTHCRDFARKAAVSAIVPVTHGATAALVDETGLVLPVLDYEAALEGVDYDAVRPAFSETFSPPLPHGLNLGRQLAWLAACYPDAFARTRHILMYPQYWAWRLSGSAAGEATSLGCHTDLWNPLTQQYSSLVRRMGWQDLFPAPAPAWQVLGFVQPAIAGLTGLPPTCCVLSGIHDSNASLTRYLSADSDDSPRTVLSTGTWTIAAAFGAPLARLRENADMLANTNALGRPVPCMRFMGGREFAALAGPAPQACSLEHIQRTLSRGTMALPCFAEAGGPFSQHKGKILGPAPQDARDRYAVATLYCVLMTDYCLDALHAAGPIAVEGSLSANPWFGALLSALRPGQPVEYSDDASGTTAGAWLLRYRGAVPDAGSRRMAPAVLDGLVQYRALWREALSLAPFV